MHTDHAPPSWAEQPPPVGSPNHSICLDAGLAAQCIRNSDAKPRKLLLCKSVSPPSFGRVSRSALAPSRRSEDGTMSACPQIPLDRAGPGSSAASLASADRGVFVTAMSGAVTSVNVVATDGPAG